MGGWGCQLIHGLPYIDRAKGREHKNSKPAQVERAEESPCTSCRTSNISWRREEPRCLQVALSKFIRERLTVDQFIRPESKVCVHGIDYHYTIMLMGMEWSDRLGSTFDALEWTQLILSILYSTNHCIDIFGQVLCLVFFILFLCDGSWLVHLCLSALWGATRLHSFPSSFFLTNWNLQ